MSSVRKDEITKGFHDRIIRNGISEPFKINSLDYESKKKTMQTKILARKQRATSTLFEQKDVHIKKRELVNLYKQEYGMIIDEREVK